MHSVSNLNIHTLNFIIDKTLTKDLNLLTVKPQPPTCIQNNENNNLTLKQNNLHNNKTEKLEQQQQQQQQQLQMANETVC